MVTGLWASGTDPKAPPIAKDDFGTTCQGSSVSVNVRKNDTSPAHNSILPYLVGQPTNGQTFLNKGEVLYLPDPDFVGEDVFYYSVLDAGNKLLDTAKVVVTVVPATAIQVTVTDETAPGKGDGTATVLPVDLTYFWSTGAKTQTLAGLVPGTYAVRAFSNSGCSATAQATVKAAVLEVKDVEEPESPDDVFGLETILATDELGGFEPDYKAWPNPFSEQVNLEIEVFYAGELTIEIVDMDGQLVRTFSEGKAEPGFARVIWKGDNDKGVPQSAGVYHAKIQVGAEKEILRIVLQR